ncbi:hypothetical protein ACKKBF_B34535 [Auxenochlorella protothecoides x Auxenochlorella symbiontica]
MMGDPNRDKAHPEPLVSFFSANMAGRVQAQCSLKGEPIFNLDLEASEVPISKQVDILKSKLMSFFTSYMKSENIPVTEDINLMEEVDMGQDPDSQPQKPAGRNAGKKRKGPRVP